MKNNPKLLEKLLEKIKNTPDKIIEQAIDRLSEKLFLQETIQMEYNLSVKENYNMESENEEWKEENLTLAA